MIFKCKNCGGNVVYHPEKHTMFCPFCESEKSEERADSSNGELSVCPNCGGEVKVEEHTSATQCPYCDCHLIFNERVEGQYKPKMLIPFQIGKEGCKQLLKDRFRKFLFAPTDFLSEARLNSMLGMYVPYWFYDYNTKCQFHGEGTKVRVWRSGNTEYTETSYYEIIRDMNIVFERMPVDASVQMPDDVMDLVAPFQYGQLEDFKPEYMSGFYGEKYNMTADLVESRARREMNNDALKLLRESYSGYATVKNLNQQVNVLDSEANYGLLPVWRYVYRYKNQDYPFYVNGQTGKIVGTPPISTGKVWAYTGTLWACLIVILFSLMTIAGF